MATCTDACSLRSELKPNLPPGGFRRLGGIFLGWALSSATDVEQAIEILEGLGCGEFSELAPEDRMGALLFLRLIPQQVREAVLAELRAQVPQLMAQMARSRDVIAPLVDDSPPIWLAEVGGERFLVEAESAEQAARRAKEARPEAARAFVRSAYIGDAIVVEDPEIEACPNWARVRLAQHRELHDADGCRVQVIREADDTRGPIYGLTFESDERDVAEGVAVRVRNGCSPGVTAAALRAVLEDLERRAPDPEEAEAPCP